MTLPKNSINEIQFVSIQTNHNLEEYDMNKKSFKIISNSNDLLVTIKLKTILTSETQIKTLIMKHFLMPITLYYLNDNFIECKSNVGGFKFELATRKSMNVIQFRLEDDDLINKLDKDEYVAKLNELYNLIEKYEKKQIIEENKSKILIPVCVSDTNPIENKLESHKINVTKNIQF